MFASLEITVESYLVTGPFTDFVSSFIAKDNEELTQNIMDIKLK